MAVDDGPGQPAWATGGVRVGLAGFGRESTPEDPTALLRTMRAADELGFDSVWFNELRFERAMRAPSPLLLAAAVFAQTERLRVGTSVIVLPLHHPLEMAEQLAQLDWQSGGRLDVGIGRGSANPRANEALGIDPASTRERFERCYDAMVAAWTQETSSDDTPYWKYEDISVGPVPVQSPGPPVYVAGYTAETIGWAVERDLPLLLSLEPPEGRQLALLPEAIQAAGKPYNLRRSSLTRYVCIGETARAAEQVIDDLLPRLHQRRLWFAAQRGTPASEIASRPRDQFLREQAIAGTPDQCIEQIEALSRDPGTGHFRCVFNGNGELDDAAALRSMRLFAREVLPACAPVVR